MTKGDKDSTSFVLKKTLGESAHPVYMGKIAKESGREVTWFKKPLSSHQEVLIECITGEIYRYIIGPEQSKIRTGKEINDKGREMNLILSEGVKYRSVRDVFDKSQMTPNKKDSREQQDALREKALIVRSIPAFKRAFVEHVDGFMRVLFASIMMEENDLSDANYGMVITRETENGEEYGNFIKIDHGQTFNSMRIAESGKYKYATVKCFPPPKNLLDMAGNLGIDKRTKSNRATMWAAPIFRTTKSRTYKIEPYFIDWVIFDFLCGFINKDYIRGLQYEPAILPVFDGRLLSFFQDYYRQADARPGVRPSREERSLWDIFEDAKYAAIAKLIFTNDELYQKIAENATDDTRLPEKQTSIRHKFQQNLDSLSEVMTYDPDFCAYCHRNEELICTSIRESYYRMIHSRGGEESARYYQALKDIHPVAAEKLNTFKRMGARFDQEFEDMTRIFLQKVGQKIIESQWEVGLFGGTKIRFHELSVGMEGMRLKFIAGIVGGKLNKYQKPYSAEVTASIREVTVPDHVAQMACSLAVYYKMPTFRVFRTLQDILYLAADANKNRSSTRKASTQQFYDWFRTAATQEFSLHHREPSDLFESYSRPDQGRYGILFQYPLGHH